VKVLNTPTILPNQLGSVLAGVQSSKMGVPSAEASGMASIFGTVLAQSMQLANSENTKLIQKVQLPQQIPLQLEDLTNLLEFLQLGHLTEIEGSSEFLSEFMLDGAKLENHPFLQAILGENVSFEQLLETLKDELGLEVQDFKEDYSENIFMGFPQITQIIQAVIEKMQSEPGFTISKEATQILKIAKVQTLLSSFVDTVEKDQKLVNEIKDLLKSFTAELQKLVKEMKSTVSSTNTERLFIAPNKNSTDYLLKVYNRNFLKGSQDQQNNSGIQVKTGVNEIFVGQPLNGQITRAEQLVLTLGKTEQPINQEQFIKAFQNILAKSSLQSSNGMQKLLIKLNPEHLGSLRIEIIQKDSMLTAKILATTGKAKEILDSQLSGLKQAFANQNIAVEKIEIAQSFNPFSQDRYLQRDQDGSGQRQHQQQNNTRQDNDSEEFKESFEEALLSLEV
jgi:flagellar hook-length control protein FliK